MIRKHLAVALSLLLVLSGSATASGALRTSSGLLVVRDAPECGGEGFTKLVLTAGRAGYGCVHTTPDSFDRQVSARARAAGIKPATAKVPCYGDGTTGPRIQMIYGYYDGLPNRSAAVTKLFRSEMAPRMQAVINGQAHGQDLGLRFQWTKGCGAIDIKTIKFPRSVQYGGEDPSDPEWQLAAATKYLSSLGYDRDDRKYQILWDGWNVGACGIGWRAQFDEASYPHSPYSDGLPTLGARTSPNEVFPNSATHVSMVFNRAGGPHGQTCFNTVGLSTVTVPIHELFHTLGAVHENAPHFVKGGHCYDAPSVMCSGNSIGYGLGQNDKTCAKVVVETLDCGEDDYWNPDPKPGSYLFSNNNIAKSQFFGPQVQDNLTSSPL